MNDHKQISRPDGMVHLFPPADKNAVFYYISTIVNLLGGDEEMIEFIKNMESCEENWDSVSTLANFSSKLTENLKHRLVRMGPGLKVRSMGRGADSPN